MDKVIIFGVGNWFKKYFVSIKNYTNVIAVSDNNHEQKEEYIKEMYILPDKIREQEYDYVIICCNAYPEIRKQLLSYGIDEAKIIAVQKYMEYIEIKKYHLEQYMPDHNENESTSASDRFGYKALCRSATTEETTFKVFRSSSIYTSIVETLSQAQGEEFLNFIKSKKEFQFTLNDWEIIQRNDLYGSPETYRYMLDTDIKMALSPTTIRYAKVLQDIMRLYDYNQIKSIAEIGVGYGGQARLILSFLLVDKYYLIDLPEVIELAKVFLDKFGYWNKTTLCDGTQNLEIRKYDFFISNYAFSELKREVQETYMKSVILQCRAGYLIWNNFSNVMYGGYSVEEILEAIPGSRVMDEVPLTHKENKLIVWGTM